MHPDGRDIDTAWNPSTFGRRCTRRDCFYDHTEGRRIDDNPEKGMCKYSVRCNRPDCLYDHPEGRTTLRSTEFGCCYADSSPSRMSIDTDRRYDTPLTTQANRTQGAPTWLFQKKKPCMITIASECETTTPKPLCDGVLGKACYTQKDSAPAVPTRDSTAEMKRKHLIEDASTCVISDSLEPLPPASALRVDDSEVLKVSAAGS